MKRIVIGNNIDDEEAPPKKCVGIVVAPAEDNDGVEEIVKIDSNNSSSVAVKENLDLNEILSISCASEISSEDKAETVAQTNEPTNINSSEAKECDNLDSSSDVDSSSDDDEDQNLKTTKTTRKFKSLPIYIVDYHHHVLEFIYRCVGSRHLPLESNTLIHFDSHPDMVISHDMQPKDTYNKNIMLEKASIESWIMPLCYTGIITRIVWIKNSWCNQLPNGKHSFHIGEHNGKLYVDLAVPYFLAESNYCKLAELSNARRIELLVLDAENEQLKSSEACSSFLNGEGSYILDIDLDFFSVNNPFLDLYEKSQCYKQLSKIFELEMICDMAELDASMINQRRYDKLKALKDIFMYLQKHASLNDYQKTEQLDVNTFQLLEKLVDSLYSNYKATEIDWMLIYDAGCTADNGGLPQHKSNATELNEQYEFLRSFLQHLSPYPPIAVTIARSSEDNYCPDDQVEEIEKNVILSIDEILGNTQNHSTIYAYLDEHYNIMEL